MALSKFEPTEMGYLHIDSCELRLEEGTRHMFLAIERVTQFTHVAFFMRQPSKMELHLLRK